MTQTDTFRKVTVHVPEHLLQGAQEFTGDGITQTITAGLVKLTSSRTYDKMRQQRGSCKNLELDVKASRVDRDFS